MDNNCISCDSVEDGEIVDEIYELILSSEDELELGVIPVEKKQNIEHQGKLKSTNSEIFNEHFNENNRIKRVRQHYNESVSLSSTSSDNSTRANPIQKILCSDSMLSQCQRKIKKRKRKRHRRRNEVQKKRTEKLALKARSAHKCANPIATIILDSDDSHDDAFRFADMSTPERLRLAVSHNVPIRDACRDNVQVAPQTHPGVQSSLQNGEDFLDNVDEEALRIVALRSAVIKKHLKRKRKEAETAYSPTDLRYSDNDVCGNITDFDVGEEMLTEISSAASPQATYDRTSPNLKLVDMDIALSDIEEDTKRHGTNTHVNNFRQLKMKPHISVHNSPNDRCLVDQNTRVQNSSGSSDEEESALRAVLLSRLPCSKAMKVGELPTSRISSPLSTSCHSVGPLEIPNTPNSLKLCDSPLKNITNASPALQCQTESAAIKQHNIVKEGPEISYIHNGTRKRTAPVMPEVNLIQFNNSLIKQSKLPSTNKCNANVSNESLKVDEHKTIFSRNRVVKPNKVVNTLSKTISTVSNHAIMYKTPESSGNSNRLITDVNSVLKRPLKLVINLKDSDDENARGDDDKADNESGEIQDRKDSPIRTITPRTTVSKRELDEKEDRCSPYLLSSKEIPIKPNQNLMSADYCTNGCINLTISADHSELEIGLLQSSTRTLVHLEKMIEIAGRAKEVKICKLNYEQEIRDLRKALYDAERKQSHENSNFQNICSKMVLASKQLNHLKRSHKDFYESKKKLIGKDLQLERRLKVLKNQIARKSSILSEKIKIVNSLTFDNIHDLPHSDLLLRKGSITEPVEASKLELPNSGYPINTCLVNSGVKCQGHKNYVDNTNFQSRCLKTSDIRTLDSRTTSSWDRNACSPASTSLRNYRSILSSMHAIHRRYDPTEFLCYYDLLGTCADNLCASIHLSK